MENLPSPKAAERTQRRKLQYLPSPWWFVATIAAVVVIVVLAH